MTSEAKRLEIRDSWKARLLGTTAGWLVRLLVLTVRTEVEDRAGLNTKRRGEGPLIWCTWHNRVLGMAMARDRHFPSRPVVVLTSASHDGAALAAASRVIGVGAVRGSSSRRGAAALKELVRSLKAGQDVVVTPDGPRGPRYRIQAGVVKAAQVAQVPVIGFHIRYSRAWRLKTWDRFVIPKPFSKLTFVLDELLEVPRELDDAAFEAKRLELEKRMRDGVDDLNLVTDEDN